jgi:hypothetical protein
MKQTLHFSVHGNFITDKIRDFVYEGNIKKAWDVFATMTEDVDIFRSIVRGQKAFDGINEFQLINTRKEDVAYEAFARLLTNLSSHKNERDQLEDTYKNHKSSMEISLKDLVKLKCEIDQDVANCEKEILKFRELMNYTDADVKLALLYKYSSKDVSSPYGWITEKGWFIPIDFQGHDAFIYKYNEEVKDNLTVAILEKRWVRITQSVRTVLISMLGFKPTAKQEQALYKWLDHHKILEKPGYMLSVNSYFGGSIVLEDGKYKLIKKG